VTTQNAVILFIVTYCFWPTLWKSSSSIIWDTLIIESSLIFCLHSIIGDYINAVILFIVTYCFWASLWMSSASIIWDTLIIKSSLIFCLHSVIGDYILLFVPSDWWILDIPLSWFQFSFLVDVIIFISKFSGLVSCLLLIFYIKRIHNLDRTWSV